MIRAITLALRYSTRPCPRGCSRSAGFAASRVPTMVINEDMASLRLFSASMVMATEWDIIPTKALKPASKRLVTMPTTLARTMT